MIEKSSFCYFDVVINSVKAHQKMLKLLNKMCNWLFSVKESSDRLPTNYKREKFTFILKNNIKKKI